MDVPKVQNLLTGGNTAYVPQQQQQEKAPELPVVQGVQKESPDENTIINGRQRQYTPEEVSQETEKINKAAQLFNTKLKFEVDYQTEEPYVLVIDKEKNVVINRIPPGDLFKATLRLQNMLGVFFDMFI